MRFKIDKEKSKKFVAIILLVTTVTTTSIGCSKKEKNITETEELIVETIPGYEKETEMVNFTQNEIKKLFPNLNNDIISNATLILLLDGLAPKDENGKISSEVISQFKSNIDSDNMMADFNSFLDVLESTMIKENEIVSVSSILPEEMKVDAQILSVIEGICNDIINGSEEDKKFKFEVLYSLFVGEDTLTIDGLEFNIRDLDYSARAVAQAYARTGAYFARDYITEEQYSKMDDRTNDQNNKAYIKTNLEILDNQMEEKSEINVIEVINKKHNNLENILSGKIDISLDAQKDLVNYLNLEYLASSKVSTSDKNKILNGYEDVRVSDVILSIDVITTYNNKNQTVIPFSELLIDEYKATETGKIDEIALNFVQYNSIMLLNEVTETSTFNEIFNNPYFQNLYKYFTKQDFTHKYKDENGKIVETNIVWQQISDGVNFINNEIILYTLNKLPKVEYMDSYIEKAQTNLSESIQYIQNTITGECEKVEIDEFVKVK